MTRTINIPTSLMKSCREDKALWELFVFAVCVKMSSKGDSKIPADIKSIRKLMGCSYYKAHRMVKGAKDHSELFFFYENGEYLVARSFTKGRLEKHTYATKKNTYTAYRAACIPFVYDDAEKVSHIAVSRKLRDVLITNAITAMQPADGSDPIANPSRQSASRPATLNLLSKASGYHRATVARHLRKLEAAGKIAIIAGCILAVLNLTTGETLTEDEYLLNSPSYFESDGYRFVRRPNRYSLLSPQTGDYAISIIFNHRNRHRHNFSTSPKPKKGENHADFANRTFLSFLWH